MSLTKIKSVDAHSPAQRAGVRPGETLTHINGRPIVDVLDYKFFAYDPRLELTLVGEDGRSRTLEEVGKEFNVTRERIRQIEAKALRKLRHPSRSKKLKDFLE